MSARRQHVSLPSHLRAVLLPLLALCLLPCMHAPAQLTDAPPRAALARTYRIAGQVVSATDGHPLRRATLSISAVPGRSILQSTLSNDSGTFTFDGLSAGKYSLLGVVHGYLPATYEQHEFFSTAIVTGAGIKTEALIMRLQPAATLAGRAFDPSGEPIPAAQVTLYREEHATGKKQIVQAGGTRTDDRGEYAFGALAEGTYFLSIRATPWYAVHPAPPYPGQESPLITGVDPILDVAYPLTFFGNATNEDAATPISLKAGEQRRADVQLTPVRAIRIAFRSEPGKTQVAFPQLQTSVFNTFEQTNGQIQMTPSGAVEMVGLPPAQYHVEQRDPKTGLVTHVSMVDATHGPVEVDPAMGESSAVLSVSLEAESGAKLPPGMQIELHSSSIANVSVGVIDNKKGQAEFEELSPGDYRFLVAGQSRRWQIVRAEQIIHSGQPGKILPRDHLQIAAGETVAVKLVIAPSVATVEGLALRKGKPAAGAMIVLVPVDAIDNAELFRRDQSDGDGTFVLPDVAAGRYIVIAIEDGWKLEWGKLDVLTPYLSNGIPLAVPAGERHSIHLPDPIAVQAR